MKNKNITKIKNNLSLLVFLIAILNTILVILFYISLLSHQKIQEEHERLIQEALTQQGAALITLDKKTDSIIYNLAEWEIIDETSK